MVDLTDGSNMILNDKQNGQKKDVSFPSAVDNYKVGAAGDVFVMNSPGTMFPSAIISKLMAYSAGSVADLVEVNIYLRQ